MYNPDQRIGLEDTPLTAITKLAEGNPGAATVLVELFQHGAAIDPDSAFGALTGIMGLDAWGIYGPRIWTLHKHVAGKSALRVLGLLRALQLGLLDSSALDAAIDGRKPMTTDEVDRVVASVQARLPSFGQVAQRTTA